MPDVRILTWDWKEQPNMEELAEIVTGMTTPPATLYMATADTGSDEYAVVFATQPINDARATQVYEEWIAEQS